MFQSWNIKLKYVPFLSLGVTQLPELVILIIHENQTVVDQPKGMAHWTESNEWWKTLSKFLFNLFLLSSYCLASRVNAMSLALLIRQAFKILFAN